MSYCSRLTRDFLPTIAIPHTGQRFGILIRSYGNGLVRQLKVDISNQCSVMAINRYGYLKLPHTILEF